MFSVKDAIAVAQERDNTPLKCWQWLWKEEDEFVCFEQRVEFNEGLNIRNDRSVSGLVS